MKKGFFLLFLFLFSFNPLIAKEENLRLILHFDVNKTLIASDEQKGKSVEKVVNSLTSDRQLREELLAKLALSAVFQSFYELLDFLNEKQIIYTIVLRTFGADLDFVKEEIENIIGKNFFNENGVFEKGVLKIQNQSFKEPKECYQVFLLAGNLLIRDDWEWWSEHGKSAKYGKLFFIDQKAPVFQIFFDDHIESASSLFNVVTPIDISTGKVIKLDALPENTACIKVDTIDAILDNSYYLNHVQKLLNTTFTFLSNNN